MKLQQGNTLASLENAHRFLDDNTAALGAVITPPTVQMLDDSIIELSAVATSQNQYKRDEKGFEALQARYRTALVRDHMAPIAKIAKLELSTSPELVKLSLPRKRASLQVLKQLADGMAEAARPHAAVFIAAGRKPDFADRLKAAANLMLDASFQRTQNRGKSLTAAANLKAKLTRARNVIHVLDALVKEATNDPGLLLRWKSAKRVVRKGGVPTGTIAPITTNPATSTPAANTTAASTPAVSAPPATATPAAAA